MSKEQKCCVCGEKVRFSVTNMFDETDTTHYCEKHAKMEPDFPFGTLTYKWKDLKKEVITGWLKARKEWDQILIPKYLVNDLIDVLET